MVNVIFVLLPFTRARTIRWRSEKSILEEARILLHHPDFKGIIPDLGGPTANMYGFECAKKLKSGSCPRKRCLTPDICPALKIDHQPQISLLKQIRRIPGIKKVFVASGIRYDMVIGDLYSWQAIFTAADRPPHLWANENCSRAFRGSRIEFDG